MNLQKSLDELKAELTNYSKHSAEYHDRMVHSIPDAEVIDRQKFILTECIDKTVLDIGCKGDLHSDIKLIAKRVYGIDHAEVKDDPDFFKVELTKEEIPLLEGIEVIICGEVLEHLSNPGLFLEELKKKYPNKKKIFSVPNAFGIFHTTWIRKGEENVNNDHVAYYSWKTFTTLVKRYGYEVSGFYWYDNPNQIQKQGFNEGLVFVTT